MRILREWSGMTQKDFADIIEKSYWTVLDYEHGRSSYSIETLLLIAKKMHLKIIIEKDE